ncbi:tripartite tricarboxylate transporter TctB family protein [Aldersonia sp. NBC_00410]|uniref:tripartite tricarboxylate transporter TctB family protein n=1 Tax=Aldersonia sp. NBC_00410 TaxID=2975954 RepID=UPI002259DED1|nr:tripartite tricarboxylate transporter TctB family protein [Aldersonia sp. NBC_00410]MCX5046185.1 tripartite tricarboxylate transporter TctB family protein [Aldersonia sp. NBC_00410]
MSAPTHDRIEPQEPEPKVIDKAQFVVCGVLAAVGTFLIVDAASLTNAFAKVDPVGPKLFPMVIGIAMLICAVAFAVAIMRGSTGAAEEGEDIDLSEPSDWRTVGQLVAIFVATILLIDSLGWAITGTFLFAGAATVLGSKHYVRNIAIGAVLAFGSFYIFYVGLGIPLPAGILDGIL